MATAQQPAWSAQSLPSGYSAAVFAAGCFWCLEPAFDAVSGVHETILGYTGGSYERPTYRIVAYTDTGHREAILVIYDAARVSYRELLAVYWANSDPFDGSGQFCDRGDPYRPAIFYRSAVERVVAEASRRAVAASFIAAGVEMDLLTPILPAETFWIAEDYHQGYYRSRPFSYRYYRDLCGRDRRLEAIWGAAEGRTSRIMEIIAESS